MGARSRYSLGDAGSGGGLGWELVDRATILELKAKHVVAGERDSLLRQVADLERQWRRVRCSEVLSGVVGQLRAVNTLLWNLEDELRACERAQDFGARFVELARSVYKTNDRRAALKRQIDELTNSDVREYKTHPLPQI